MNLLVWTQRLKVIIKEAFARMFDPTIPDDDFIVALPKDDQFGELTTNIALVAARAVRQSPMAVAQRLLPALEESLKQHGLRDAIERIEIKTPGFINFFFSQNGFSGILKEIFKPPSYGRLDLGQGKKVNIEFVSANPTGPLSVAHARQAAVGDALASLLEYCGYDVTREYYVNDEGLQIILLGKSLKARAQERLGAEAQIPEGGYRGEYMKTIADEWIREQGFRSPEQISEVDDTQAAAFAVAVLLRIIQKDLEDFGVRFDVWSHQSLVADPPRIERMLEHLREKGYVYEKDGALWFRSTRFGDDKDRVVKKQDGSYTYFAPDIVYHQDKYQRGYEWLIDLWGPDHHGYIARLKAAVTALGYDPQTLTVLIVQLATLYRDGRPVQMSTRAGEYVSLREVIDEVGCDAARCFFLMRRLDAHLDFDLTLAKQETPENPVFYIQYAHARIRGLREKAQEAALEPAAETFDLLLQDHERRLIRQLGWFPGVVQLCHDQRDPYPMMQYLLDTAGLFHRFYDAHRIIDADEPLLSAQRLGLAEAARRVLQQGLTLLGLSAPERM